MSTTAGPELRTRVVLRWRDMDMLGHLNQAVYHELLEEGRSAVLERIGAIEEGWGFVLARVELDHLREVRPDDAEVDVVVRVERIGRSSVTLAHDVRLLDGTVAATGRTVLVGWDPRERRSRPLTDAEKQRLGAPG